MAKPKKTNTSKTSTHIESIRHKDKRANIPTEELRDFVADDERTPKTMLYPRDPSLDPQLAWKGKDEQDRQDLAVPVVPIYIQEKIHPQALIDAVSRKEQANNQFDLFADFNGLPEDFDQRVDFYRHDGHWSNRMILGDSLLVMASLAEKEGLKGEVQTIYFDPPYGIKFRSNWQVSTRKRDVQDGKAEDATRQPEQVRAFRDTWKLGIHSYLAYLRDRLIVARELLTETGSLFVQISDENIHLVRCILDEVFGRENFCRLITFTKTNAQTDNLMSSVSDYILWYAKQKEVSGKLNVKVRPLFVPAVPGGPGATEYKRVELQDGSIHPISKFQVHGRTQIPEGARVFATDSIVSAGGDDPDIILESQGKKIRLSCRPNRHWKPGADGIRRLWSIGRLLRQEGLRIYKRYFTDFPYRKVVDNWTDTRGDDEAVYVVQTDTKVIERCLLMTSDPGDLVLDPTCGSGTTAYVAEQWGRRWITCDTSRVALALARTRLMVAKYPYYLLADSQEGIKKEAELTGKMSSHTTGGDIRKGFICERVPHIKLKSIASNPDIKEGMSQAQLDAAIARHAEPETLHDKPYKDTKTVRVAGPFTVESLSPHRVLSAADDDMDGTVTQQEAQKSQDFATMILDNLRKAGIQNTKKAERLTFDQLTPFAGTWLQATGTFTDAEGKTRRVAVSIGPEHGTVGPMQVKEAAKEAVQGVGYDLLILCGFAFDPHVSEEAKRYGKLTVLPTKMNPDLAMGDELLKKTGAGNLFMVFGEPDVEIRRVSAEGAHERNLRKSAKSADNLLVEIKGVDVYDPTTGEIRSSSTDDIACWFIDTAYNGESFFVRHAYFTGADQPYEKLKRALRAEVDESAWATLYSTTSRPFACPSTGKIAVKVINHYGDEVLKVFEV